MIFVLLCWGTPDVKLVDLYCNKKRNRPLFCGPVFTENGICLVVCLFSVFTVVVAVGYVSGLRLGIKCFFGVIFFIVWCVGMIFFPLQLLVSGEFCFIILGNPGCKIS